MIFGFLLMIWAATAEEFWKRNEAYEALHWGMEDFSERDVPRPEFFGTLGFSQADRKTLVKRYPAYKHLARKCITDILTLLFNVLVIAGMLYLYSYHDVLLKAGHKH